jgi:hypothetical protein
LTVCLSINNCQNISCFFDRFYAFANLKQLVFKKLCELCV